MRTRFPNDDAGPLGDRCAVRQAQTRSEVESAIKARGADVYAGFLLPYLRPDMSVLDCGCGKATITLGLAEAVPNGRVVGVDLDKDSLLAARYSAVLIGRGNLACILADGRQLPFHDAAFDAVLCHSMLETLDDPANVMTELRRVTKHGGVVGAASVDYGGDRMPGSGVAGCCHTPWNRVGRRVASFGRSMGRLEQGPQRLLRLRMVSSAGLAIAAGQIGNAAFPPHPVSFLR